MSRLWTAPFDALSRHREEAAVGLATPPCPAVTDLVRHAAGAVTLALVLVLAWAPPTWAQSRDDHPFIVWMSPSGDDAASGMSRDEPVRTLARVHRILCPSTPCTGLGRPVEVRIEPGRYAGAGVGWRYFDDEYPTRFMPADYRLGDGWSQVSAAGGRPVFDGQHAYEWGVGFRQDRLSGTGRTNLQFWYIEWRNWLRGGLQLAANRELAGARAEGNVVYGSYFSRIGNNWSSGAPQGYGAISVPRSDRNTIRNNHFVDVLNAPQHRGHEHGVYLLDARYNEISANRFERIGGDAVRVRNRSSSTLIEGNRFIQAGQHGYAGDWYCTTSHVARGECSSVEQPSLAVTGANNVFGGLYGGGKPPTARAFCYDIVGACPTSRINIR
jgi:hypothetical protein